MLQHTGARALARAAVLCRRLRAAKETLSQRPAFASAMVLVRQGCTGVQAGPHSSSWATAGLGGRLSASATCLAAPTRAPRSSTLQ